MGFDSESDSEVPSAFQLREHSAGGRVAERFSGPGLTIGRPYRTRQEVADRTLSIPPALQRRHVAHLARTGEGKTTTAQIACLDNALATEGLDLVVDPKGGFAAELLPMYYHADGDLSEVVVLDAAEALPRLPLFDLRPYLSSEELTISRERLIEIVVEAAIDVFAAAGGDEEAFGAAAQSIELLRSVATALFRSGVDAFSVTDLIAELQKLRDGTFSVSVDDGRFQQLLEAQASDSPKMRSALVNGALRRITPLVRTSLMGEAFGTVPTDPTAQVNWYSLLDSDRLVIIDMGGLNSAHRETLARAIVTRFFIAGRLRQRDGRRSGDRPLANLYLDEAHTLGDLQTLLDLLSEGRSFDISVYLMSQLLAQFGEELREHIRGNIGTLIVGHTDTAAIQAALSHQYAERAANRIAATLLVGDWLVRTRAPRGQTPFEPFVVAAPQLREGHPEWDEAPTHETDSASAAGSTERATAGVVAECSQAIRACRTRSLEYEWVVEATVSSTHTELSDPEIRRAFSHTLWLEETSLPAPIAYDPGTDSVVCADGAVGAGRESGGRADTDPDTDSTSTTSSPSLEADRSHPKRWPPTFDGVWAATAACSQETAPSEYSLPIVEIGLTVDPWEAKTAPVTVRQLMFLRLIERARRRAIDVRAWDIVSDTMLPLREAAGCTASDEALLEEAGYITLQTDLRGKYYHLTDAGRELLRKIRNGRAPPEPKRGDSNESAAHIKGVETAVRALQTLANDGSSPIDRVERYWSPPDANTRLDVVGLDATETVVIAVEVERPTNDLRTGVPDDYDAMAAVDPQAALWVVSNRKLGHRVVEVLVGDSAGESRLPIDPAAVKAETTPLDRYDFEAPGCTAIRTLGAVTPELFDQLLTDAG